MQGCLKQEKTYMHWCLPELTYNICDYKLLKRSDQNVNKCVDIRVERKGTSELRYTECLTAEWPSTLLEYCMASS